jgi:sugar/nucleoside kinase (ribokinase family)
MDRKTSLEDLQGDNPTHSIWGMLGVGGIGSGTFFLINGEHTLGREESRSGHFIDRRDYCKLHIISHYVKALLGDWISVLPIGKVGDDEAGKRLMKEMGKVGLDLRHVQIIPGVQTLYSFCFLYPDGSGGNLTIDNSASDMMGAEEISQMETDFRAYQSHGIALAAPEAPLVARQRLLQMATKYKFLRVASFTSAEIEPAIEMGLLGEIDFLAMNRDEAVTAAGMPSRSGEGSIHSVVKAAFARLAAINPALHITITSGKRGSWSWDGQISRHLPAFPSEVVSTAGAGDAFLAGVIAGKTAELDLSEAQELGLLVAAHAVTSPHTIDPRINRIALRAFASKANLRLSVKVGQFLSNQYPISVHR